jgi:hypothetical protein
MRTFSKIVYLSVDSDLTNTSEDYWTIKNIFPNSREVYRIINSSYSNTREDYVSLFLSLSLSI